MLTLVERGILTTADLISSVEAAISTKRQMIDDREHSQIASVAVGVLSTLAKSLPADKTDRL
jgi:hypothetical protein